VSYPATVVKKIGNGRKHLITHSCASLQTPVPLMQLL